MNKCIVCILINLVPLLAFAPVRDITITVSNDPILWGIVEVESGANMLAYNAKENAVGLLQIRDVCVRDANRIANMNYTLEEMYNPFKAITVFYIITNYYGGTQRDKIERWNGGNIRNKRTAKYYKHVTERATKVYSVYSNTGIHPVVRWIDKQGKEYVSY